MKLTIKDVINLKGPASQIAKDLGVTEKTISSWKLGKSWMPEEQLNRLGFHREIVPNGD